jgi:hypothetical protein
VQGAPLNNQTDKDFSVKFGEKDPAKEEVAKVEKKLLTDQVLEELIKEFQTLDAADLHAARHLIAKAVELTYQRMTGYG